MVITLNEEEIGTIVYAMTTKIYENFKEIEDKEFWKLYNENDRTLMKIYETKPNVELSDEECLYIINCIVDKILKLKDKEIKKKYIELLKKISKSDNLKEESL